MCARASDVGCVLSGKGVPPTTTINPSPSPHSFHLALHIALQPVGATAWPGKVRGGLRPPAWEYAAGEAGSEDDSNDDDSAGGDNLARQTKRSVLHDNDSGGGDGSDGTPAVAAPTSSDSEAS